MKAGRCPSGPAAFAPEINAPHIIVNNNFDNFMIYLLYSFDGRIIKKIEKQKQVLFIFFLPKKHKAYSILAWQEG